jgi:hypothetical protein
MATEASIDLLHDDTATKENRALLRAKWILKLFRKRAASSFGELFGDPGWTILLDLFVREAEGKKTIVSGAVIGSMAPPTTGLRWVHLLTDKGLLFRSFNPNDTRIAYINLSEKARIELTEILSTMP